MLWANINLILYTHGFDQIIFFNFFQNHFSRQKNGFSRFKLPLEVLCTEDDCRDSIRAHRSKPSLQKELKNLGNLLSSAFLVLKGIDWRLITLSLARLIDSFLKLSQKEPLDARSGKHLVVAGLDCFNQISLKDSENLKIWF